MSLYSIKMRGSKEDNHISGAESIVEEKDLQRAVNMLIKRAMNHSKGKSDFINVKIEALKEEIEYIEPLEVTKVEVDNPKEGFNVVKHVLKNLGIAEDKADKIIDFFKLNNNMRGAMLLDINTLKRLESDKKRGVRVTYMDFQGSKLNHLSKDTAYNAHFIEALALATKVASCPNIIGEICFSDDPNYTAGYISSKKYGYIRISQMKKLGESQGGRIFLYDSSLDESCTVKDCINYLQNKKVIIKDRVKIKSNKNYKDFIK